MKHELNIILADDHRLFREGLRYLLEQSELIKSIQEAENGIELLKLLVNGQPDIVLMDINMPIMNGIEATKKAIQMYPEVKIIALSMYSDEQYYSSMIEAGAKGFMVKNSEFDEVELALHEVYEGRNYFSPEILQSIVQNMNRSSNNALKNELTQREIQVLLHICKGESNQEIAQQLFISKRTVDKHRENILLKSQSKNTAELVVYAIKYGYFKV